MTPLTILGQEATTISELEEGIVEQLKARVQGVAIEPYPDKPEGYRLVHQAGALLVAYRAAKYSEPQSRDEVIQERTLFFDVHVLSRSLRGHQGAYTHLEAARGALTGHQLVGFWKLVPTGEAFVGREENVWMFALTVAAITVAAEEEVVE